MAVHFKVKKEFHGLVSVRGDIISKCRNWKQDLVIEYGGSSMRVPFSKLEDPFQLHKKSFKSKFNDEYYSLYDFKFVPDSVSDVNLFNIGGGE